MLPEFTEIVPLLDVCIVNDAIETVAFEPASVEVNGLLVGRYVNTDAVAEKFCVPSPTAGPSVRPVKPKLTASNVIVQELPP